MRTQPVCSGTHTKIWEVLTPIGTTPKIIANMKESFDEADELDGFEDLEYVPLQSRRRTNV